MRNVLITGINGFIGKHLALKYKMLGYEILSVDREVLGNPVQLNNALKDVDIEYIFHLASYGNHSNQDDENEMIATNILKTWFLLDATKDIPYKAFINVSSSSVYGVKEKPMSETDSLETTSLYGATKISGEFLARYQALSKNKPIVNVRPFSVYGMGEAEFRFIPTVIKAVNEGIEFQLDPEVNHDWIMIFDLIDGLVTVAKNAKKLKGQSVNIGTGIQTTNKDVVDKIKWILDKKATFKVKRDMREYKPKDWLADIDLIKSLGWSPKVDLFTGLKETVKYYVDTKRTA